MTAPERHKQPAAERAVEFVTSGMIVGLGSGTTAGFVIARIGALLRDGVLRDLLGVPTSAATEAEARRLGNTHRGAGLAGSVGSGLNYVEPGLRLRYEIRRGLAPYVGLDGLRRLGGTARFARSDGDDASDLALVVGVRAWH